MPKPKRSTREQIERYKRKLLDLENSDVKKKRRKVQCSSGSDASVQGEDHLQNQQRSLPIDSNVLYEFTDETCDQVFEIYADVHEEEPMEPSIHTQPISVRPEPPPEVPMPDEAPIPAAAAAPSAAAAPTSADVPTSAAAPTAAAAPTVPAIPVAPSIPAAPTADQHEAPAQPGALPTAVSESLDPTLLAALGESNSDTPEYGTSIHDTLANIWLPLLKKGMAKDNKEKLLKEYLIPNNCKLLQAPKLNAEISAAVSEVVRGRDKKYVALQQQLGQGIAAVSRAMDILLKTDNKVEALKYMSDGCRILSDSHNFLTRDRIKMVTPSLEKNFLHVIQDAQRDEFLFGTSLSEKIKASKAIERQGQQIKKSISAPKPGTSNSANTRASTSQGNWSGPPRYSSNRGGRGGNRKTNPSPATRRPYINTAASTRQPAQSKSRAPAHQ